MTSRDILLCCLALTSTPTLAESTSLISAYHRALQNDATLGAARAAQIAGREELPKGFAGLLPSVSISGTRGKNQTESTTPSLTGLSTRDYDYDSKNYSLTIRQPVYRPYNYAQYELAKATVGQTDATFEKEALQLMVRLTGAYLDALLAEDNIRYAGAQKDAISEQLQQAKKLYEAGVGTVTDISEAQARHDTVVAQGLEAENSREVARRSLEEITGTYPDSLFMLDSQKLPLDPPEPNDIKTWIEWAMEKNPEIQARKFNLEAANQELEKNRAGHYPTLDLTASRTLSESDNNYTINSKYDTTSVGLQLNIPIYAGGYVDAAVRQAVANQDRARQLLTGMYRTVGSDTRKAFLDIVNGIAQIRALEQAVTSNESALLGTRKGFEAGMRSNVDVLNAQQQLFSAKRDLAKARYTLIINRIKLKSAVGLLSEADLEQVNGWLSATSN